MKKVLPEAYVREERRRVFVPDALFARRVVSAMGPVGRSAAGLWDYIPGFARPVAAATALALLVLAAWQLMDSPIPQIGIVEAYLRADSAPSERWLYHDAEPPEGYDLLVEISAREELP